MIYVILISVTAGQFGLLALLWASNWAQELPDNADIPTKTHHAATTICEYVGIPPGRLSVFAATGACVCSVVLLMTG